MIEVFKILNHKYDLEPEEILSRRWASTSYSTRGHNQLLFKERAHLDIRKYSSSFRVVDIWRLTTLGNQC